VNFWSQLPFVRICFAWIAATMAAFLFPGQISTLAAIIIISLLITAFFLLDDILPYKYRRLSSIILMLAIVVLGYSYINFRQEQKLNSHFSSIIENEKQEIENDHYFVLRILEDPEEKTNSYKAEVEVVAIKDSNEWHHPKGKMILYFEKDSARVSSLAYGDYFYVYGKPNRVKAPSNPGEFDYKRFLERKGIYHQLYLASNRWIKIDKQKKNPIYRFALNCRSYLLDILQEKGLKGEEYAVASAILLGYSDKIDAKLLQEYSGAGAMHILCVSGLHVGIVYVVFSMLLFFLGKTDRSRFLKSLLLILLIWSYAILTGLSPSVMRASAMFSLVAIGQNLRRDTNIFNTLSASAFILMLIDPLIILNLGFQLSYSAVLGIVLLQPPIYRIFTIKSKLLDKIWTIIAVSIAAQIGTLPITLYYFHQFPNYFILTNILVIPSSAVVIYTGVAVLFFSFIPYLSVFLANTLSWMIKAMNFGISGIESLPGSVSQGIYLQKLEMLLLYLIIIFFISWIYLKKKNYVFLILGVFLILFTSISYRKIQQSDEKRVVFYAVNNATAMEFSYAKESVFLCDSSLLGDKKKQEYFSSGYRYANGIRKTSEYAINQAEIENNFFCKKDHFLTFANKKMVILNENSYYYDYSEPIAVDCIFLSGKMKENWSRLSDNYKFQLLILDNTVPFYRLEEWKRLCEENKIYCYSLSEQKAMVLKY
jgi:competence protein ComEC